MSERDVDGRVTVTRLSTRTAVREGFGALHVRRWIESVQALRAVRVQFVTRVDENRVRVDGLVVFGAASRRLGSGHITPRRVLQGTRGCSSATLVQSVGYRRQDSLEHTKIPCGNLCVR
jgi:hypothetical protein